MKMAEKKMCSNVVVNKIKQWIGINWIELHAKLLFTAMLNIIFLVIRPLDGE